MRFLPTIPLAPNTTPSSYPLCPPDLLPRPLCRTVRRIAKQSAFQVITTALRNVLTGSIGLDTCNKVGQMLRANWGFRAVIAGFGAKQAGKWGLGGRSLENGRGNRVATGTSKSHADSSTVESLKLSERATGISGEATWDSGDKNGGSRPEDHAEESLAAAWNWRIFIMMGDFRANWRRAISDGKQLDIPGKLGHRIRAEGRRPCGTGFRFVGLDRSIIAPLPSDDERPQPLLSGSGNVVGILRIKLGSVSPSSWAGSPTKSGGGRF